jgi:hypothetical protein
MDCRELSSSGSYRFFGVVFVLDGHQVAEALLLQFGKDRGILHQASSQRHIPRLRPTPLAYVLQMEADDPAFQFLQAFDRLQA